MPWVQTDRGATLAPEAQRAEVSTWNIAGAALPKVSFVNCPSTGWQTSQSSSITPSSPEKPMRQHEVVHKRKPKPVPGLPGAEQRRANQIV